MCHNRSQRVVGDLLVLIHELQDVFQRYIQLFLLGNLRKTFIAHRRIIAKLAMIPARDDHLRHIAVIKFCIQHFKLKSRIPRVIANVLDFLRPFTVRRLLWRCTDRKHHRPRRHGKHHTRRQQDTFNLSHDSLLNKESTHVSFNLSQALSYVQQKAAPFGAAFSIVFRRTPRPLSKALCPSEQTGCGLLS